MADVSLPPIRINFPYSVEIDFPAGFLQAGEGVRTKLRQFVGQADPVLVVDSRNDDTVTWEIGDTSSLLPGTYFAEAELYDTADPDTPGEMLTDNRYVIRCNHSPSE